MEVKNINTRIQNKYDSLSNWQASNLELLPGEIAFVKVLDQKVDETTGESYTVPAVLAKVGETDDNGEVKTFEELPWLSAKASDVYDWAKQKEKPNYTLEELGAEYAGAAVTAVSVHNLDNLSHSDIRTLIDELMERVDTLENNPSGPSSPDGSIVSGVQSDWDETDTESLAYIKNKPFEELATILEIPSDKTNSIIISSYPIEDMDGLSFSFIKINESTFDTAKDTYGGILKVNVAGELLEFTINEENIVNLDNGFGVLIVEEAGFYPLIMNVSTAGTSTFYTEGVIGANLVFDNVEPGLYFLYIEGMGFVQSLNKPLIKKLDSKFIPSKIGTWENMPDKPFGYEGSLLVEWDKTPTGEFVFIPGTDDNYFYKVSDIIPTKEELIGATLKVEDDGNFIDMVLTGSDIKDYNTYCYGFASLPYFVVTTQATEAVIVGKEALSFPSEGVWFVSGGATWAYHLGKEKIKTLEKKYLPSGLGSWEDMPDKPFSESGFDIKCLASTVTDISITVYSPWHGTVTFYKIAEAQSTSMLDGQVTIDFYNYPQIKLPIKPESDDYDDDYEYIPYFELDSGSSHCIYAFNIVNDNETVDLLDSYETNVTFPEKGFYIADIVFKDEPDMAALRVVSANYKIKHIDNKFIQNAFYEIGANITWDGTPTDICESASADGNYLYFYKVSDPVDSIIGGTVVALYPDGEPENVLTSEAVKTTYAGEDGTFVINVKVPNSTFSHESGFDISFSEPGLYFVYFISYDGSEVRTKSFKTFDYELKQIDKKFIPSGVTSWNDLADKPFGETTITWDGTHTSEYVDVGDGYLLCKVSDGFCTPESLIGKKTKIFICEENTSYEYTITSEDIYTEEAFAGAFVVQIDGEPGAFITTSAITIGEVSFPSAGTWFLYVEDTAYLCYLEGACKQIDPSYIPEYYYEKGTKFTWDGTPVDDTYIPLGQIVEWDGSDTGVSVAIPSNGDTIPEGIVFYKVAEKLHSLEGSRYTSFGNENGLYSSDIETFLDDNGNTIATCGKCGASTNMWIWNVEQVAPIPVMGTTVTFPDSGLYFISMDGEPLVTCLYDSLYNEYEGYGFCRAAAPLADDLYGWVARVSIPEENYILEIPIGDQASGQSMKYLRTPTGSSCGIPYVFNIVTDNETIDLTDWFGTELTFPKAGLYMYDFSAMGVIFDYFVSPDYQLKKIDKKFLPDDISGSGSSAAIYSGHVSTIDEDAPIDLAVVNYEKVMAAGSYVSSMEELWPYFTYDVQADEFILAMQPMSGSGECLVTAKSNNIRIGLCSKIDASSFSISEFKTVIELYSIKNIDISNKFTIKCYRRPGTDWYDGFIETGVANKVQINLDLPVTSDVVYNYLANMGLDSDKLEDTRIKANTYVDWAENDSTSMAYIKNRLVYDNTPRQAFNLDTKPEFDFASSFGTTTFLSKPAEYRRISLETIDDALELAKSIKSFYCNSVTHNASLFTISGNKEIATIKSGAITSSAQYAIPYLIIKTGKANPNSTDGSWNFGGITTPSAYPGIYSIVATDDNYPNRYVSQISFNPIPHKLPVKYIPTDVEVTQNSENLISSGAVYNALTSIENNLQFDTIPTVNSEKLVKSGGIATALSTKADKTSVDTSIATLNTTLNTEINKKANQTDVTTSVNNLTAEINKKANQTDVTSAIDNLTTEVNKKADTTSVYSKSEIDSLISGAFHYKGSINTYAELPMTAEVGDVYNVKAADTSNDVKAGDNVVWCEIDGVGHWDVLSGIVDLSAYWTGEETQGKLAAINEELQAKVAKTELSKTAVSNSYLDLDNKPCYYVGVDQLITGDYTYSAANCYYSLYYYPKRADYIKDTSIEDYINYFKSISYGTVNGGFTTYTKDSVTITKADNDIAVISISLVTSPLAFIVPTAGLSYNLMDKKVITFTSAGIYCLVNILNNTANNRTHVNELIFEADAKILDLKLLPEHSHTMADIEITDEFKFDYLNLDNKPLYYTGIDQTISYNGQYTTNDIHYNQFYYIKCGEYSAANIQEYLEGYITLTYAKETGIITSYTADIKDKWHIESNGLLICEGLNTLAAPYVIISPKDNLTYKISGYTDSGATLTFNKGIYCLRDTVNGYVKGIAFKATYYPMDIRYLPTHNHSIPIATSTTLGGVKVGDNLSISEDGTISATSLAWDNVQDKPELYTKEETYNKDEVYTKEEVYTKDEVNNYLGTKQDKSNLVTAINSVSQDTQYPSAKLLYTIKTELETDIAKKVDKVSGYRLMTDAEGVKLANIAENANKYSLPAATKTSLGGVKVGDNLSVSADGTISATSLDWGNVQNKPEFYTKTEINSSLDTKQDKSNLVTAISSTSQDTQYPSAKLLYTTKFDLQTQIDNAKTDLQTQIDNTKTDLQTQVTNVQTVTNTKQDISNLVTSIDENSTDTQYPSAKLLYTTTDNLESTVSTKQDKSNLVISIDENSTDDQYPSAKLLYDICGGYNELIEGILEIVGEVV